MKAVEDELPGILRNHREDFRALGDKYETEILKAPSHSSGEVGDPAHHRRRSKQQSVVAVTFEFVASISLLPPHGLIRDLDQQWWASLCINGLLTRTPSLGCLVDLG